MSNASAILSLRNLIIEEQKNFQNKTFANYTVIVFPKEKEKVSREHVDELKRMNIGIPLFDPILGAYETLVKAKKQAFVTARCVLYASSTIQFVL